MNTCHSVYIKLSRKSTLAEHTAHLGRAGQPRRWWCWWDWLCVCVFVVHYICGDQGVGNGCVWLLASPFVSPTASKSNKARNCDQRREDQTHTHIDYSHVAANEQVFTIFKYEFIYACGVCAWKDRRACGYVIVVHWRRGKCIYTRSFIVIHSKMQSVASSPWLLFKITARIAPRSMCFIFDGHKTYANRQYVDHLAYWTRIWIWDRTLIDFTDILKHSFKKRKEISIWICSAAKPWRKHCEHDVNHLRLRDRFIWRFRSNAFIQTHKSRSPHIPLPNHQSRRGEHPNITFENIIHRQI